MWKSIFIASDRNVSITSSNISKQPKTIVQTNRSNAQLRLSIWDNGKGFDATALVTKRAAKAVSD